MITNILYIILLVITKYGESAGIPIKIQDVGLLGLHNRVNIIYGHNSQKSEIFEKRIDYS